MAARPYGWHPKLLNAQLDPTGGTANRDIAAEPNRSKRPGDHGQCRGPTCAHRSSPDTLHQPSVACNSGARTFCSTSKNYNFNDTISMFEMFTRELHATFLRTIRGRKEPPEDTHVPGNRHNCQKHGGAAPDQEHCTRSGALHPIRGTTPDQGHCTRSEEVHCLRIGCSAPTHKNKRGTDRTYPLPATTRPGTGHRAGNDDPVSAGNGPSPRPRWPQYRSGCPVRRCDRPLCRRLGPCR